MGDGSPSRFDSKGKKPAYQNGDVLALNLESAEEGASSHQNGGGFMQMQLMEQQVRITWLEITLYSNPRRITIFNLVQPR